MFDADPRGGDRGPDARRRGDGDKPGSAPAGSSTTPGRRSPAARATYPARTCPGRGGGAPPPGTAPDAARDPCERHTRVDERGVGLPGLIDRPAQQRRSLPGQPPRRAFAVRRPQTVTSSPANRTALREEENRPAPAAGRSAPAR